MREARTATKRAWKRSERNAVRLAIAGYLAGDDTVEMPDRDGWEATSERASAR